MAGVRLGESNIQTFELTFEQHLATRRPQSAALGYHYVRELAKILLAVAAVEIYDEMRLRTRTCVRERT